MTTTDLLARLGELAALQDGWLDDDEQDAVAVPAPVLACAREVLPAAVALGMPVPHLFPDPDGGISAMWTFGSWEVRAYFRNNGVETYALNVKTDEEDSPAAMPPSQPGIAMDLCTFVQWYAAKAS